MAAKQPGFLKLRITWDKGESELRVRCYEARGLKNTVLYVKAYLQPDPNRKSKQKTKPCKRKTPNPKWTHSLMTFPLTNLPAHMDRMLEITVWEKGSISKDFQGRMAFKLSELLPPNDKDGIEGW